MLKNSIPGKTLYKDLLITKLANFGFKQSGRDFRGQRNGKTGTIRNSVKKTLIGIFGRMATKSRLRVSTYSLLLRLNNFSGDIYAYFKDGDIYGSQEEAEKPFVCSYSIKEKCSSSVEES